LIGILVAIAVIGVIGFAVAPQIMNTLELRTLENSAREVVSTLDRAKFQAIKTKLNHRIRFDNTTGPWMMLMEQETAAGTWDEVRGFVPKPLSLKFKLTFNLPADLSVVFSPSGLVVNYDATKHSIVMQSDRMARYNQPDQREIIFYYGGSVRYLKSSSG
jgi:Tfp pilus assembly protein FimT